MKCIPITLSGLEVAAPILVIEIEEVLEAKITLSGVISLKFLKMDNLSLGYTFNKIFSQSSSVRLSASVQNVFTISGYSGVDPEVFGNGIDNSITPRPRTFLIGANVRF